MSNNLSEIQGEPRDITTSTTAGDSSPINTPNHLALSSCQYEDVKLSDRNAFLDSDSDQSQTEFYILDFLKQKPQGYQDQDLSTDEFLNNHYKSDAYENELIQPSLKSHKSLEKAHKILANHQANVEEIKQEESHYAEKEQNFQSLQKKGATQDVLKKYAEELAKGYNRLGMKYNKLSLFADGFELLEKSLKFYQFLNMEKEISDLYDAMGYLSFKLAKNEKAIDFYNRALELKIKLYGREHPKLGLTYYELAKINMANAKLSEAETSISQGLRLLEGNPVENRKLITLMKFTQAQIMSQNGELNKAETLLLELMNKLITELGEHHDLVKHCCLNLSDVEVKKKSYDQAAILLEKAYQIEKRRQNKNPLQQANITNKLGVLYLKQKNYKAAIQQLLTCYEVRKKLYTIKHPEVAMAVLQIADVYTRVKEFDKAKTQINNAYKIYTVYYGKSHPTIATCFHSLGNISYSLQKYDEARDYYEKSLAMDLQFYSPGHPQLVQTYEGLAYTYEKLGNKQKALENYKYILKIRQKEYGEGSKEVAALRNIIYKLSTKQ